MVIPTRQYSAEVASAVSGKTMERATLTEPAMTQPSSAFKIFSPGWVTGEKCKYVSSNKNPTTKPMHNPAMRMKS